jgi:hypothetical protein
MPVIEPHAARSTLITWALSTNSIECIDPSALMVKRIVVLDLKLSGKSCSDEVDHDLSISRIAWRTYGVKSTPCVSERTVTDRG